MNRLDPDKLMDEYERKKAELDKLSTEHRHNIGVLKLESQTRVFDLLADTLGTLRTIAQDIKEGRR